MCHNFTLASSSTLLLLVFAQSPARGADEIIGAWRGQIESLVPEEIALRVDPTSHDVGLMWGSLWGNSPWHVRIRSLETANYEIRFRSLAGTEGIFHGSITNDHFSGTYDFGSQSFPFHLTRATSEFHDVVVSHILADPTAYDIRAVAVEKGSAHSSGTLL